MKQFKLPYKLTNLILMFFCFAFLGWIWEVSLNFMQYGFFANRGVLNGPILPIYGWGGISAVILLDKYKKKPVLIFVLVMIIATLIEYGTSCYLEYFLHARWWDYSGYLLNINGRVCLLGAIFFGLGGCLAIYYAAPLLNKVLNKIKLNYKIILAIVFLFLYITDSIYSGDHPNNGNGITTNNNVIEKS